MHIEILFEDDILLLVNKPSGLLIHPGMNHQEPVLTELIQTQIGQKVQSTHRLDWATSGVLVLAKTKQATRSLNEAFAQRKVRKTYIAVVSSRIEDDGKIDEPMTRRVRAHGRKKEPKLPSRTSFVCIERSVTDAAWLEVTPHTGRQHQIRRHLRHIRCPIWGDKRYNSTRHNRQLRIDVQMHRLALHSAALSFFHPETSEQMTIIAPLPDNLRKPCQKLGFSEETLNFSNHSFFQEQRI